MSHEHLPLIGRPRSKMTAKPPLYAPAVRQSKRKHSHHQTSTSSSQPHPGPSSILSSDTSVTPWGVLDLYESSFTTISLLPPPPPPTPPTPQLTTSTPFRGKQNEDREDSAVNPEVPSSFGAIPRDSGGGVARGLQVKQRVLPRLREAHPSRLPPLHVITNLSFSRSFTFSFFELPVHHSANCRAERIRNLMLI